jgi:hypothetical protein
MAVLYRGQVCKAQQNEIMKERGGVFYLQFKHRNFETENNHLWGLDALNFM